MREEGEHRPPEEVQTPMKRVTEGKPVEEERSERAVVPPFDWQEQIITFTHREPNAPTVKVYPDEPLYLLRTMKLQAERAGDTNAVENLDALEDGYVFSTFPFLSRSLQRSYTRAYYEGGTQTPTPREKEHTEVLPLTDEQYHYLGLLLESASIPAMYELTDKGSLPQRVNKKNTHVIPVQTAFTQMRQVASEERIAWNDGKSRPMRKE